MTFRTYMDKYTYHHFYPKLNEPLVSQRHNSSVQYYSKQRGATIIKSSHFRKMFQLGRKISLVCVAQGKPRPSITWLKDGIELNSFSEHEHVFEWKVGAHKLKVSQTHFKSETFTAFIIHAIICLSYIFFLSGSPRWR